MEQLFSLPAPSAPAARTATSARAAAGRDGDRFGAALRDAIDQPRGRDRSHGPADRGAQRTAARVDRPGAAGSERSREAAVARDASRTAAQVDGEHGPDGEAAPNVRRGGSWTLGQLARDLIAQLDVGSLASRVGTKAAVDGALVEDAAATILVDEAESLLAELPGSAEGLTGDVDGILEELAATLDAVDADVERADAPPEGDGLAADAADAAALLAQPAEAVAAPIDEVVSEDGDAPVAPADGQTDEGQVTDADAAAAVAATAGAVAGATPATDTATTAPVDDEAADVAPDARRQGPTDVASPRAAERAGERGPGEPVRANEAGPPRSPRAEERAAEPRVPATNSRIDAPLAEEGRIASISTEGVRSTDAPRAEAVRQTTVPSSVQRVLDLVAQLEKMPPPRQLVLELGDLRVRVGMDDGQVRLTVLSGDRREADSLLADARDALAEQGFDLAGDGSGAADTDADDADARPGERLGNGPADRARGHAADRARADARTAGLRL